jgi:hypothetical protein
VAKSVAISIYASFMFKMRIAPLEPMLCSVAAGVALIGRSERAVIDMIARGQLQAVKSDRRTLIVVQSLRDYVATLPAATGTKNPRGAERRSRVA